MNSDREVIDWLLETSNPFVRYLALRDILNKTDRDPTLIDAGKAVSGSPTVEKILSKMKPGGYWGERSSPYLPKYKTSYWTLILLGWLGMDGGNKRVRKACDAIFEFQMPDGGFSPFPKERAESEFLRRKRLGRKLPPKEEFIPWLIREQQASCLTGNMCAALIRMGYEDDRRVRRALAWLIEIQNVDGGWQCPYGSHRKDKHACFHGTICVLEGLSEIPPGKRSAAMRETIEQGAEFMLMHRLYKADHHDFRVINPRWLEFRFPWFWEYSVLRGLDVMTRLGYADDERMSDAVDVLLSKRLQDGRWTLEKTWPNRMQANLEPQGEPSKWITLISLRVLKRLADAKGI